MPHSQRPRIHNSTQNTTPAPKRRFLGISTAVTCQLSAPLNSTNADKATTGWLLWQPLIQSLLSCLRVSRNLKSVLLGTGCLADTLFVILQGSSSNHMGTRQQSSGSAVPASILDLISTLITLRLKRECPNLSAGESEQKG